MAHMTQREDQIRRIQLSFDDYVNNRISSWQLLQRIVTILGGLL